MRRAESTALDDSLDLDTLRDVLRAHPVELAILFGSHAGGDTHSASDIDIAVEFTKRDRSDPRYNDVFLGLSADLSAELGTDDVDLVDLHAVSRSVAESIFAHGVLLVGEKEHAANLRRELLGVVAGRTSQSPRDRIDAYLDGDDERHRRAVSRRTTDDERRISRGPPQQNSSCHGSQSRRASVCSFAISP